ncbi:MAG: MoaF N-terminal domain-containing protein [Gemmatimonadales bacterium]
MGDIPRASAVRGTTMRWTWTDGPTKGKVHEHVFHDDGTVEWHDGGASAKAPPKSPADAKASGLPERVPYAAFEVTPKIFAVSYLATSGFTLTVVLDFATKAIVGIASGAKEWFPVQGTFEVVA